MKKDDFYKILCTSTPEELNAFISSKGSKKMVNAVTFIDPNTPYMSSLDNNKETLITNSKD